MLEGRAVLVTGAARGIGRGIAEALSEAGARIALLDRDGDAVRNAASELASGEVETLALEADVSDREAVERAVDRTVERFGAIDGLVNNAGLLRMGPALESDATDWRDQFEVNLLGTFLACRAAGSRMIEGGRGGAIVNVASNAGKVGYPNMAAYNATKAAVIRLTQSLAAEWAEHDINVNAVCPGGVDTDMLRDVAAWIAERTDGDAERWLGEMVPQQLGRHVRPIEVGRVVAFLLSDDAAIVRGQAINTDGGDAPY
ncbi:MAG: SDR family NAD(P)-dependent oxidoreductase [Gemmatimonadota bacterium]|nr:SDR family NAD(P)-dependent oxidoreductase [Gemmatimonadota bacterium]